MNTERLLREIIALPSVNPAFMPPGDPRAGEHRVADFLAAQAGRNGLTVQFQVVTPERRNLLASFEPAGDIQQTILLAPHLDTVGRVEMPDSNFQPIKRGKHLHGRGACDTKGSVAAMFSALVQVAAAKQRPRHTRIVFAGLIDEENNQIGSRAMAASGFEADLAIVGEPTCLQTISAHKGDLWLKLRTEGRAAHGAKPHLGINAVHRMAKVVQLLEGPYAAQLKKRKHPLLGHPTVNVGSIHGGTQPNIVPAECEISVDRRTIPGETEESVRAEINQLLKQHKVEAVIVNHKVSDCLPMETDADQPLVQLFLKASGRRKTLGVDFFCDASILSAGGIPSIVFGPGDIAQAHTADEWIDVDQLAQAQRILVQFLQALP